MTTFTLTIAILFLLLGIGLVYWIKRRKFYRRNLVSLKGFSSFEASVSIRFLESLVKWLAYKLILFSILSGILYNNEKRTEDKQQRIEIGNEVLEIQVN